MPEFSNALVWFRRDLRTRDQSALYHALRAAKQVHCLFVFDESLLSGLPEDDRRVAFLHESVLALDAALREAGGCLRVAHGDPTLIVPAVAKALGADALFFNHDYEPSACARDAHVRDTLEQGGIVVNTYKDQVIFEKSEILTGAERPYSVFTPYKRAWLAAAGANSAHSAFAARPSERHLNRLAPPPKTGGSGVPARRAATFGAPLPSLADLGFGPARSPTPGGEDAALSMLEDFEPRIDDYHRTRDFPALASTSGLSVHLRFGTVSVRALARTAHASAQAARGSVGADTWLSELVWRDFFCQILHHHPRLVADGQHRAFKPEYDRITWEHGKTADKHFAAWCEGRTGFPLVDAAMRQINQTGFMHNRVRMVVATFLCKDLGIDWRRGEAYFERLLNDFDLSANNGNWQWASSSGCDAQPWFRIFNPVTQSEKFDGSGVYIRRYVPELAGLDDKSIHAPWLARPEALALANVDLGRTYPRPLVDHAEARQRTLERYDVVKSTHLQGGQTTPAPARPGKGQLGLALDD
jgi:deoxyribodipyrimidine photo-lyase